MIPPADILGGAGLIGVWTCRSLLLTPIAGGLIGAFGLYTRIDRLVTSLATQTRGCVDVARRGWLSG